tara:strand:+ start:1021 stop:1473 length:453 start_codon:yes stop_codon:yes gene_type:complete
LLNILKNFFENKDNNKSEINKNLELLCGLMIEAANTDGEIDQTEKAKINSVLVDVFNEDPDQVINVLNKAIENRDNSKSLHFYTSKINKEYSEEKKILLLQILWEIVLSDGKLHDYESSLIRRLAGLLYISDVNSGNARKRALNNISNKK